MCICNSCDSKDVIERSETEIYTYKSTDYEVLIHFLVCNSCHDEFLNKEQILRNEINIREAKKKIDGLLSAEGLREIRKQLKLTQEQASEVFGGGRNAFSKYERSEVSQSVSMDKLIRLSGQDRYIFRKLLDLSSIEKEFDFTDPMDLQISGNNIVEFPNAYQPKISTYDIETLNEIDENKLSDISDMAAVC